MMTTIDGREAYAYTGGKPFDKALPVVVFIHGAQHDHSVWALQSRWFAHHGHAVLAVDLPGHGRSAGPPLASIEEMAAWIAALLDTVDARDVALVGHSMGSLIALEIASRDSRVVALALIATAYPMRVSDALLAATRDDEPRAIEMISLWSLDIAHGGYSQKPSAPGPGFSVMTGGRQLMRRQVPGVLTIDFVACNAYRNGEAASASVRCPTLFVLGQNDAMTQARSGRALAATIAGAKVVEFAGVGHFVMAEAPDETLDTLRAFIPASSPMPVTSAL